MEKQKQINKFPNLIGISGKINSGKDTVGKMIEYLTDFYKLKELGLEQEDGIPDEPSMDNFFMWDYAGNEPKFYKIVKFADKLKDCVCLILGCTREQLEDSEFKSKELGEEWKLLKETSSYGAQDKLYPIGYKGLTHIVHTQEEILTPRKILQLLGTECGRQIIHPNIWINATFADYKPIMPQIRRGRMTSKAAAYVVKQSILNPQYPNWIITDCRFPNEAQAIKDRGGILIRVDRNVELRYSELWKQFHEQDKYDEWDEYLKSINQLEKVYHPSETALDDYKDWDYVINNNGTLENLLTKIQKIYKNEK